MSAVPSATAAVVRPARLSDVAALHQLVESAYRGDSARTGWTHEADLLETPRSSPDSLAAVLEDANERLLVLVEDERIVGCVQVSRRSPTTAYFGLLTVDPTRQADGFGRRLIAAAEAEAATSFGSERMELTVISIRAELVDYYRRRGYRLTGEERPFPIEVDPPLALAVMEKRIGG
jgi:GNAT superfamily N-acetyltransferase